MSGVLTITILDCQEEDSGTYRCVCCNSKGEASDYATLEVSGGGYTTFSSRRRDEEAPKAYVPEVTRIDHYHTTHFKAGYASKTYLEVEESKSKLTETHEVVTHERYGASTERYSSAERYDSSIKYASTEYLSSGSSYSSDKFSLTGKQTASEAKMKSSSAAAEEVSVHKVKPSLSARILTKPQSVTVAEGEAARFFCDIDGEPAPTVTWMHESQTIVSSNRIQVTTTQYKSSLEISSVTTSDEGRYTVVVENSADRQEAHFTLTIHRPVPKEPVKSVETSLKSPTPSVKSPEPSATSPAPSITSPIPSLKLPEPSIKSPEPSVTSAPSVKSPTPSVKSPTPSVKSPEPSVSSPAPSVKSPTPSMKSPEPEGIKSPRSMKSPEPSAPSPASEPEGVKSPRGGVKSPEPRVKSPGSVKSPEPEDIKSPRGVKSPEPAAGVKSPRGVKSPEPAGAKTLKGIKSPEPSGIKSPRALKVKSPPPIMSPKRVVKGFRGYKNGTVKPPF
uniref:Ig-like domain-containing protein n=1 Tax=Amphiprion percula TaxID=161767 RepID=A0A3P8SQ31_AMPPE